MNIEIHGRHALLFDDDTAAAFVNSDDALVEWNSLLIDRYDVRHLLSTPPPSRRRRNPQPSHSSSADADLDHERYLDLPSPSDEEKEDEKPEPVGGFNAVPFSYGNDEDSNDQKAAETEPEVPKFHPPFSVPDSLAQNLPPTEKVHQIIARTALFVSKNGGQSEIILRVKQGDNPTFGFLMPDHHLHPYFRFLVENQDLLHSKDNGQTENAEKISNTGALSLLGSVYGTGEDDDGGTEQPSSLSSSKESVSGNSVKVDATDSLTAVKTVFPLGKDEPIIKRNSLSNALKVGRTSSIKKDEFLGSLSSVPDKSRASSLPPIPKTELMLVDPPTDMKRLVEKIVEFIIKNGRQFEAVLMEQDRGHGRFPFLIPSNIFHPYYLKVLQKAQESKLTVKSFYNEKEDFGGHISNKKKSTSRENGNDTVEPDDIPLDSERKEKFKMVINKSKKEGSDLPDKSTQSPPRVQVDADQAAAILQAATRGIRPSTLGILYGQPSNKDISSESQLTHEQKLKAERLKRAKMFVAQLKSGAAPIKAEPSRSLSAEPQVDNRLAANETEKSIPPSDVNTSDNKLKVEKEHLNEEKRAMRKYRARSIIDKKSDEDDNDDDDDDERDRKRSHRHHTKKHRSHNHSGEDEREENCVDERDYKHDKRRHRSHRSSHKHDDMDKISEEKDQRYSKKKHRSSSSYEDDEQDSEHEYSRKKHRTHHSSHDEVDSDNKYSRKKHRTHHSSHDEVDSDDTHSRRKRKHRSHKSSHRHKHSKSHSSRHKEKLDVSSEEESRDQSKTDKNVKGPNSEREELEEGEITSSSKGVHLVDGVSREPSVDVSSSFPDSRPPSQPSGATEVSDDLRAKIRAMLMSTM
ncbi:hypothetical protein M8C21_005835 [Ambrosia artemisiifolia]|uniref:SURP motif domain-containing protein n=1 Tax=Ambrosia artemisiifolia TaxID=4212 RepID=A0AAD5CYI4_AMBAR|nr:hypothetical protein M8C21_005835 [Ambrosia artemisiifolia]